MNDTNFITPRFLSSSNLYEVNVRQYTTEGTFAAFSSHLPRLKHMGVEILWFMPIHPIGIKNRKGSLGSYYSVRDFNDINPEYGTKEDFKNLVTEIHALGMKVIIDWVANHAAWDNVWTENNPDFFLRNDQGEFKNAFDWDDVIQINHESEAEQHAMINAMENWVTQFNIDGFRADLAHLTPLPFWIKARKHLSNFKNDLIWLAETEEPSYHNAFDISYTWKWMHEAELFCKNERTLADCVNTLKWQKDAFPTKAQRMFFTSNHDENSWNGTEYEKYGKSVLNMAILSCTYIGIPLLYTGQELPNKKRLPFFDKDTIDWQPINELHTFYKTLFELRKTNSVYEKATINDVVIYEDYLNENIVAFSIIKDENEVWVFLNFSDIEKEMTNNFLQNLFQYKNVFTGEIFSFGNKREIYLAKNGFLITERIPDLVV
jgi:glycosidase